jgi:hypothetical protein
MHEFSCHKRLWQCTGWGISKRLWQCTGWGINKTKTKYTKLKRNVTNLEQDLIIDGQIREGVQNFRYLGIMTK